MLDGAPNDRGGDLAVPGNISLLFLPHSPERNPKGNLWDEIREKFFKNYALKSIDAVRAKLKQAILYIERNPETVKSSRHSHKSSGHSDVEVVLVPILRSHSGLRRLRILNLPEDPFCQRFSLASIGGKPCARPFWRRPHLPFDHDWSGLRCRFAASLAQQGSPTQPVPGARSDWRPTATDRAAFLDARIAGLKAALKLSPEQEKLWTPVAAVRETAAKREARMDAFRREHEQRQGPVDAIERMRRRGEMLTETGVDLKKIADAAVPLYAALDDAQKHRMDFLLPMRGPHHHFRMAARENRLWRSHRDRATP